MRKTISTLCVAAMAALVPATATCQVFLDPVEGAGILLYGLPYLNTEPVYYDIETESSNTLAGGSIITGFSILDEQWQVSKKFDVDVRTDSKGGKYGAVRLSVSYLMDRKIDVYSCDLTQCVFNTTPDYEYVLPVLDDNVNNEWQIGCAKGFQVMGESGNVICELKLPDGYVCMGTLEVVVTKLGVKMHVNAFRKDADISGGEVLNTTFIYSYTPGSSSNNAVKLEAQIAQVGPRIVSASEPLSVSFTELVTVKTVEIYSVSGMLQHRQSVAAGIDRIIVDTDKLSKGMNIVRIVSDGRETESFKVLVR